MLRQCWTRLGVAFDERFSRRGSVDLERLIMDTCVEGRKDPRLLFGMRGWLLKHHDLVNANRLIRMVRRCKETAVLGAIIDSVLEHAPRSSLRYVKKYCRRSREPAFVFEAVRESNVMRRLNEEENLHIWQAWGLISREMESMEGAVAEKKFVFRHNHNLALRALFGSGMRAEIFNYLLEHKEGNAYQISQGVGQSYEPVYSELKLCENVGLLEPVRSGRATAYHLTSGFLKRTLKQLLAA